MGYIYFGEYPHNKTSTEHATAGAAGDSRALVDAGRVCGATNRTAQ
jgi:hypothetical protein